MALALAAVQTSEANLPVGRRPGLTFIFQIEKIKGAKSKGPGSRFPARDAEVLHGEQTPRTRLEKLGVETRTRTGAANVAMARIGGQT